MLWDIWSHALDKDNEKVIERVVEIRSDYLTTLDMNGKSNLDICVVTGSVKVLNFLLTTTLLDCVNQESTSGCTPLIRVVRCCHKDGLSEKIALELAAIFINFAQFV